MTKSIAVLLPCYNEEISIKEVISKIQSLLPQAAIYVFNNNSTDRTAEISRSQGAIVINEKRQGKGFVVQSMFKKIDADIYIMVDGDNTYDLSKIQKMIAMISNDEADVVVGRRFETDTQQSLRRFHAFGNKLIKYLINTLFRTKLKDVTSGLRVMNRTYVKNINIMASGFEVETEMTIKALRYGYLIKEVDINYKDRPHGSYSKLNTIKDGTRVLITILAIFKNYKPLLFFTFIALSFLLLSLISGSVVIGEYIRTKYIEHIPLAILSSGAMILSIVFFVSGVILDSINNRVDELYNFIKNK